MELSILLLVGLIVGIVYSQAKNHFERLHQSQPDSPILKVTNFTGITFRVVAVLSVCILISITVWDGGIKPFYGWISSSCYPSHNCAEFIGSFVILGIGLVVGIGTIWLATTLFAKMYEVIIRLWKRRSERV